MFEVSHIHVLSINKEIFSKKSVTLYSFKEKMLVEIYVYTFVIFTF